jgi:multidrug efflux pump subunit AcrA (membrane-fusion protein)
MPAKRFIHSQLERRFSAATKQDITSAKRLHLCSGRLIVVALILCLAGCNSHYPAAHGLPPPEVTVSKPEHKEVVNWEEFTGQTSAVNLVNISARVSGYIVNIPFKEGDLVHEGDLLYQIDPRPYQAAYDQAIGQLKVGQANQQYQDATFNRNSEIDQNRCHFERRLRSSALEQSAGGCAGCCGPSFSGIGKTESRLHPGYLSD